MDTLVQRKWVCYSREEEMTTAHENEKEVLNKPLEEMTPEEQIEYWKSRAIYAEAEAEYLKKLHAVVQARKAQQQKKK